MRLSGQWLTRPETRAVMAALTGAGHRALFVGGVVRNALLGQEVSDIDISTDARPQTVMQIAVSAGLKAVPTGIDHGTVTLISGGVPHEVTTFRRDVETDGRRAVVAFSDRVEEDAARRDFTMNALYAEADGTVVDPLGGLPDALARRVRFIGHPEDRIREDYLRILRFFRFQAWYGHPGEGVDAEGLAACAVLSRKIDTLAHERIGHELLKLLAAPDPAPAVASMAQAGVLAHALPGADPRALAPLVHLEDGLPADPIRRLAALGGDDPANALRLSRAHAKRLEVIRQGAESAAGPDELAWRFGEGSARDAVLVRAASLGTPLPDGLDRALALGSGAVFPVKARDLMPELTGRALGDRMAELQRDWIASGFTATRDELLAGK